MPEAPVINAGPLIHLCRAGQPALLQTLAPRIVVPEPVAAEIRVRGEHDVTARALAGTEWLAVLSAPDVPREVAAWDLGAGEASVLAWALTHPGSVAIVDDLQGRRCALALGIPVIGTLGVVLAAKRSGSVPAARPIIDKLVAHGMYLSPQIIDQALALVNE